MTPNERRILLDCAETILALTAALDYWERVEKHGQVYKIKQNAIYAAQVEKARPYLEAIEGQAQGQTTDEGVYEALRKIVSIATTNHLPG